MDVQSTMATMQVYLKSPSLTSNTCVLLVQMKPRELINQKNTYGDSKENVWIDYTYKPKSIRIWFACKSLI